MEILSAGGETLISVKSNDRQNESGGLELCSLKFLMSPLRVLLHIYSESCWETLWLKKWGGQKGRGWACCHRGLCISTVIGWQSVSVNVQLNIHQYDKQMDNYISWHVTCWTGTDFIQRVWRAHFWFGCSFMSQNRSKLNNWWLLSTDR